MTERALMPTGMMRGWLQPVRTATLAGPVSDVDGTQYFAEGDEVALQFWGGGITYVTKLHSNELAAARTNTIHIYTPRPIDLDFTGQAGDK